MAIYSFHAADAKRRRAVECGCIQHVVVAACLSISDSATSASHALLFPTLNQLYKPLFQFIGSRAGHTFTNRYIVDLPTSNKYTNGSVLVYIPSNYIVDNSRYMLPRPGNLKFNQFCRVVEAGEMLFQVKWTPIIGTQSLKGAITT